MVSSFVSAVTLMLAFIFGPPVGYARLHKRDGLSLGEGRFYCTYCAYRYIRTKLHPLERSRSLTTCTSTGRFPTDVLPRPRPVFADASEYGWARIYRERRRKRARSDWPSGNSSAAKPVRNGNALPASGRPLSL